MLIVRNRRILANLVEQNKLYHKDFMRYTTNNEVELIELEQWAILAITQDSNVNLIWIKKENHSQSSFIAKTLMDTTTAGHSTIGVSLLLLLFLLSCQFQMNALYKTNSTYYLEL